MTADREHRAAIRRHVNGLQCFLAGYASARYLADDPNRAEALAALADYDRERFLAIEAEITWPPMGADKPAWIREFERAHGGGAS